MAASVEPLRIDSPSVPATLRRRARDAAFADPRWARRLVGHRVSIVGYASFGRAGGGPCDGHLCVRILAYDSTARATVKAFVRVDEAVAAVDHVVTERGRGPGLGAGERSLARRLAQRDRRVVHATGGHAPPLAPAEEGATNRGPCAVDRCAILAFRTRGGGTLVVAVDLISRRVAALIRA